MVVADHEFPTLAVTPQAIPALVVELASTNMRRNRRLSAVVTLLGFITLQWLVMAHACAMQFHPLGALSPIETTAPAAHHCAATDKAPINLCLEHCSQGKDVSNTVQSGDAPAPVAIAFLTVPTLVLSPAGRSGSSAAAPALRSHSPPPLILSQRLRI
jgi:hypothetical protein